MIAAGPTSVGWAPSRGVGGRVVVSFDPVADICPIEAPVGNVPPFLHGGPTNRPYVALTIDDTFGVAGVRAVSQTLDVLAARNVHATFFPTGGALEQHHAAGYDEVWRRAARSGSEIGNHTYSHARLPRLSNSQIRNELQRTQDILNIVLGPGFRYQMRLMRPPGGEGGYGNGDPRVLGVVNSMGLSMVMWTIETHGNGPVHAAFVARILRQARPGSVILMHPTQITPAEIGQVIDGLRARGLEPTTVTGLFP
jgi:peptidoglycan/xylan/chitin deacetylase (PgdA/CDA1 family)